MPAIIRHFLSKIAIVGTILGLSFLIGIFMFKLVPADANSVFMEQILLIFAAFLLLTSFIIFKITNTTFLKAAGIKWDWVVALAFLGGILDVVWDRKILMPLGIDILPYGEGIFTTLVTLVISIYILYALNRNRSKK